MPAKPLFATQADAVKQHLLNLVQPMLDALVDSAFTDDMTPYEAEKKTWSALIELGRSVLNSLFGALCFKRATQQLGRRHKTLADVLPRRDSDGIATVTTTLGEVTFAAFAWRERRGGTTKKPANALFPYRSRIRSSRLALEWEAALGSDHPFRSAEIAIAFFSHDALTVSDNTIERHAVAVGKLLADRWLYRPPAEIRAILRERATVDALTQRPIVYTSTDAHMLTRYVDETWNAEWKGFNGLRVWCVD